MFVRFFTLLALFYQTTLFATIEGHGQTSLLTYTPAGYSVPTNMLQSTASTSTATSTIPANVAAQLFVNFKYDTSNKNVRVVYTTDGSTPTKVNGTVVDATFSNYSDPDRTWTAQIPGQPEGTVVKYVFYISDGNLADSWGRIVGTSVQTTWTEGDAFLTYSLPLPVELFYINAVAEESKINLSWATASEQNNSHFEIERSIDGRSWTNVGVVKGAGTSFEKQSYTFIDNEPSNSFNYYRLKQVDADGIYEYSKIVMVDFSKQRMDISIYPNPVSQFLRINGTEGLPEETVFEIVDLLGTTRTVQPNSGNLDISDLSNGVFFLRYRTPAGNVASIRFVKD